MLDKSHQDKILYLITQAEFGGAQKYVFDLAANLVGKYQIEVGVGSEKSDNWLERLESRGIKVWRLKYVVRKLNLWHDLLSGFELYQLINKTKPNVVHLNSSKIGSTGAVMAWLYKKIKNKKLKIIYTVHGLVLNEPLPAWQKIFYWLSEKVSGWCKDKIICVSEFDKKSILKFKLVPAKKIAVIYNGIDLNNLNFLSKNTARQQLTNKLRAGTFCGETNPLIGTIANLYSTKGLIYLIQAAKNLINQRPDLNLIFIVIGKGALKEKLEQKIKKLSLAHNFFLVGSLKNAARYLPAFDVFVLPSVKEGLSYTLIEALAAGVPIVATKVGGNSEIIENNKNGLLVPPVNPTALAKAVMKILTNPDLTQKFRKNNSKKINHFNLQKMIKETQKIYQ